MSQIEFDEQDVMAAMRRRGVPHHMHDSVIRYLVYRAKPGSFLRALFANDLVDAIKNADMINTECLHQWAAFMYSYLPSRATPGSPWGSYEAVDAWCSQRAGESS
jgi:ATP sulfurylase